MSKGLVTVFGADGFLGHYVVRALVKCGWRVRAAVRQPHLAQDLRVIGAVGQVQLVQANVRYRRSIDMALQGADAVINLTGILHSKGAQSFNAIHNVAVKAIANSAAQNGISNSVQVSAIGANQESESEYLQSKARGEAAMLDTVPTADIVRPSILFGKGDGFFSKFASLTGVSPVLPLIGGGKTRFQPVYAGDVAAHIVGCLNRGTTGQTYELGGPCTYTFKELMQFILAVVDKDRFLLPLSWFVGSIMGFVFEFISYIPIANLLVKPLVTRDQVQSLKLDNVVSGNYPGLVIADATPTTIEAVVPETLISYRKYGQFHQSAIEDA